MSSMPASPDLLNHSKTQSHYYRSVQLSDDLSQKTGVCTGVFKATVSKLPAPLSCFAFANLANFPLNFRSYRGSGEQRRIRQGSATWVWAALQPAGPRRRSAQRYLRSQGRAAAFRGCWRYGLSLDLRSGTLLNVTLISRRYGKKRVWQHSSEGSVKCFHS